MSGQLGHPILVSQIVQQSLLFLKRANVVTVHLRPGAEFRFSHREIHWVTLGKSYCLSLTHLSGNSEEEKKDKNQTVAPNLLVLPNAYFDEFYYACF